jgi:hypothetical protein
MTNQARQFASEFDRIAQDVLDLLWKVPLSLLDHPFPTAEGYSLFVLATYLVEVGEFWIVGQIGRKMLPYRSLAEFCATGTLPALIARYQRWLKDVHEILDNLPDEALDQPLAFGFALAAPAASAPVTVRACLEQALRHISLIREHMRLLFRGLLNAEEPPEDGGPAAAGEQQQGE